MRKVTFNHISVQKNRMKCNSMLRSSNPRKSQHIVILESHESIKGGKYVKIAVYCDFIWLLQTLLFTLR